MKRLQEILINAEKNEKSLINFEKRNKIRLYKSKM